MMSRPNFRTAALIQKGVSSIALYSSPNILPKNDNNNYIAYARLKCVYCVQIQKSQPMLSIIVQPTVKVSHHKQISNKQRVFKYIGFDKMIRHIQNKVQK